MGQSIRGQQDNVNPSAAVLFPAAGQKRTKTKPHTLFSLPGSGMDQGPGWDGADAGLQTSGLVWRAAFSAWNQARVGVGREASLSCYKEVGGHNVNANSMPGRDLQRPCLQIYFSSVRACRFPHPTTPSRIF